MADNETHKILELTQVTAGYNDQIALENVNLTVNQTDFIGVIGANGGGKTTLLKIILGLVRPLKGTVRFFFNGNGNGGVKQYIGYMPQVAEFDRKFPVTVFDVVLSGLATKVGLFRHFSREDKNKAYRVLERMGVSHLEKNVVGQLSGGQMQRVFLARALIASPRLLLLDEPDTFVDKGFEKNFYVILKELNKEIAIILVSHDLGTVSSYVKSIACVNGTLFYHPTNELTHSCSGNYNCPIDLITHGDVPHRVLKAHTHAGGHSTQTPQHGQPGAGGTGA
jgi:zinc transport system ATP-binding protein